MAIKTYTDDNQNLKLVDNVQTTPRTLDELSKGSNSVHASRHAKGGADEISQVKDSDTVDSKHASDFVDNTKIAKLIVSNWTIRTSAADNDWFSVCWSPELSLFCAVAISGTGNRVMTSPDGINWTIRTSAADNNWVSVCWSPELSLFCAVAYSGTGNRVMTSPDGINWTIRTSAADNNWRSVCWSPELSLFCAVANTGTGNRVMTSLFAGV